MATRHPTGGDPATRPMATGYEAGVPQSRQNRASGAWTLPQASQARPEAAGASDPRG